MKMVRGKELLQEADLVLGKVDEVIPEAAVHGLVPLQVRVVGRLAFREKTHRPPGDVRRIDRQAARALKMAARVASRRLAEIREFTQA